jgi:hypothetical protein
MSRNVPFVNTSQACSVRVVISNQGLEPVQSFYAKLVSDDYIDSLEIPNIAGGGTAARVFYFNVGGTGSVSGIPPQILQPVDNTALFIIESPAILALAPISVVSPPGAMDDTVAVDQILTLSTSVSNSGMADIEGVQRLTLDAGNSGFNVLDSTSRDFVLDEDVFWDVQAPASAIDSAHLSIRFLNRPIDSNDGGDAVGPDSVSSRVFVVNTDPAFSSHIPVISAPPGAIDRVLSTGQSFVISDTIMVSGIYENLVAFMDLPAGFSTEDPLLQTPVAGLASWTVRAPDSPTTDSVAVESWLFNPNTGDSVGTGPTFIVMDIVEKAILNLQSGIIGPRAALDGIIEPGASIQYEAVVQNLGQASAGEGVIGLHLGNPDMLVIEDPIQPFNPDIPLVWNITVPDSEVLAPIPIWTGIDFLPFDENTDAPAFVLIDSSGINISIRELLPYMVFSIRNRDRGGSFSASIDRIGFLAQIDPQDQIADVFSEISLVADSIPYSSDFISADTVAFVFDNELILEPGQSMECVFRLVINELILEPGQSMECVFRLVISQATEISSFRFFLNSDHVTGSVLEEDFCLSQSLQSPGRAGENRL